MAMRGSRSCAAALAPLNASPTTTSDSVNRMSVAFVFEARDDPGRSSVIALAHFVDERHRVLQQADLRLEVLDEARLRRLARGLRPQRGAALADRLVDDREVLLQRGRRPRIERVLLALGDLLESRDCLGVMLFGRAQL